MSSPNTTVLLQGPPEVTRTPGRAATRRRYRFASLIAAICTATVAFAAPAGATLPEHSSFDFTDQFSDPDYCASFGFAFDVTQHEYGFFTVYFDADGKFVKAIVHNNVDFTLTANGKTLVERDTFTIIFTPDGHREIGSFAHIQGDHGIVLRDAGQLVFDADDQFLYARGPHPQFFGETFCSELAP